MRTKILFFGAFLVLFGCQKPIEHKGVYKRVVDNYGIEVNEVAYTFNIPSSYLKALILLECSGRKDPPSRYEKHVYKRLKRLKQGRRRKVEQIRRVDIIDASDEALKNLARSWGPYQLMGYKCLQLGITVSDIRGKDAVYWGAKWINEEYGDLLRAGDYEGAFRYHNTGNRKGKTADPDYVQKGLVYMEYFELYSL